MLSKVLHDVKALDNDLDIVVIKATVSADAAVCPSVDCQSHGFYLDSLASGGTIVVYRQKQYGLGNDTNNLVPWVAGAGTGDYSDGSTPGTLDHVLLGAFAKFSDEDAIVTSVTTTSIAGTYIVLLIMAYTQSGGAVAITPGTEVELMLVFKNSGLSS